MATFVDASGRFLGVFVGTLPPSGAIEVSTAPADARQVWQFPGWSPPPADMRIAPLAFIARFSPAERAAIRAAAAASAELADWLDRARFAREINLADPVTISGMAALEQAGLISTARATAILQAQVAENERP